MNKYEQVLEYIFDNDYEGAESVYNYLKHKRNLSITCQTNYIDIITNKTNKFFFKLYMHDGIDWEFYDYGYLQNNYFYALASKILLFNIQNIEFKLSRRQDSINHIIIEDNNISYLLFNPNHQIIDELFKYIQTKMI
ncbi:hypothetical protein QKC54_gp0766 [Megavirus baoshan]|uniref:Uncharacterized protein n=1 Tax=Megavirus baoshan TaxID=2496520 RepID=A0A3S5HLG1_9VIRU|nr:hypothetical protein QKC54_gp0766 [Megavirus baoshan]AZL89884.1 hypothetical protein Mb0306 [Megavirus baoshan]